jgi:hypothetical protein
MASILSNLLTKSYTISELMAIDSGRQERASGCSVVLDNVYHEIQQESILEKFKRLFFRDKSMMNIHYVVFKFKVTSNTGNTHTVIIRTHPDYSGTEGLNNRIQIYCTCKDFQFRSAYVLNKHKSLFRSDSTEARLGRAITEAPKKGHSTSLLCKHAFAALSYLQNNYSYIMQSL